MLYCIYFLLLALSLLIGVPAANAENTDPDVAACNNIGDLDARIAGCTRLLARKNLPARSQAILYLQRAQGYVRHQQFDRAIQDYDASLKRDPNSAIALGERAVVYNQIGDPDADQAIRLDPNYVLAYAARGNALSQKGQFDQAIVALSKSIGLDPKQQWLYINRSTVWNAKGETDRAIADLDAAIRLDPKQAVPYNNRCWVWTAKGELDNALADCNQALELDANFAVAYSNRGVVWFQKGELDSALSDFNKAIRIDPSYWAGFTGRGDVWRKKGELDRALADFQQAVRISPRAARSFVSEGLVFEAQGQIDRARSAYQQAVALPTSISVIGAIGPVTESFRREQEQTQDASRSAKLPSGLASPSSLGKGATTGAGTLLAFSTAPGQIALDGDGANSPFSLALARHIGTPGLEVQQMLTRVRAEVVSATHGKQVPWSNSSLLGEVYLAGKP